MRGGVSPCAAPNVAHHVILYNSDFSFTGSRNACFPENSGPGTVLSSETAFFPRAFRNTENATSRLCKGKEYETLSNQYLYKHTVKEMSRQF